jgi:methyl-accepting chemotaxis protein
LTEASRQGRLGERADLQLFQGSYPRLVRRNQRDARRRGRSINESSEVLAKLAAGDLQARVNGTFPGDYRHIQESLAATASSVGALVTETQRLIGASREGRLSERADARRFQGSYRELCEGVNQMLDGMVAPIRESSAVLRARRARRSSRSRCAGQYSGEYGLMKESLNRTVASVARADSRRRRA